MNAVLENLYVSRDLLSSLFGQVCTKYSLTPAEVLVLLFLANNREYDTAKDIVDKLRIAKSHVSVSVKNLEERGYLKGRYQENNRRTIHLRLCELSGDAVAEARRVQERFLAVLGQGFSEEELAVFTNYLRRVNGNMNAYLKNNASGKEE